MKTKYPFKAIIKYIPTRYTNLEEWQVSNQKTVFNFKKGMISDNHKQRFLTIIQNLTVNNNKEWVVAFVPASTKKKTEIRYKILYTFLKNNLSCPVYLDSIKTWKEYEPVHINGRKEYKLHSIQREHFVGKNVILIDDVITSGQTFREVANKLIYIGALSIYGVCFAFTIHPNKPSKYKRHEYRNDTSLK